MPTEGQHALPRHRDTAITAAWAVLIIAAVTSGTYNMVHAFEHSAGAPGILPFLYGAVPPVLAALLAHVAAAHRSSRWIKAAVIVVTVVSMSLSISAVASVAAPMGGRVMSVVFGLAVDAAAMTALVLILDNHRRRAVEGSALDEATAAAREAGARAITAEASAAAGRAEADRIAAELERVRAELEAVRNRAPGRSRRRNSTGGTARPGTARNKAGTDDANVEAAALAELAADSDITGAELARRLDVSDSYGRRLKRDLAKTAPSPGAP